MIKKIKNWIKSLTEDRSKDRIIMVMHPKVYFPKGRVFEFNSIPWVQYQGERIERNSKWKVIKHIDHVHIKIRPIGINNE